MGILKTGILSTFGILFLVYSHKKLVPWAGYQKGMVLGFSIMGSNS